MLYLYTVTANGLVTGSSVKACGHGREGRHQQTVDFVCVTLKHCLALSGLDIHRKNESLVLF